MGSSFSSDEEEEKEDEEQLKEDLSRRCNRKENEGKAINDIYAEERKAIQEWRCEGRLLEVLNEWRGEAKKRREKRLREAFADVAGVMILLLAVIVSVCKALENCDGMLICWISTVGEAVVKHVDKNMLANLAWAVRSNFE